jgi:hypothetical protein
MITPYCNFVRVGEELPSRNIAPLLMPFPEGHGRVVRLTAFRLVTGCTPRVKARDSVGRAEPARNCSTALLGWCHRTRTTIHIVELDPTRWPSFRHDMDGGTTMGNAKHIGRVGALAVDAGGP